MRWGLGSLTAARRRPQGDETVRTREPPEPRAADWRRVTPLGLTIAPRPTLVGATLLGPPEVSGTRSLIRPRPDGTTSSGAIANGRVTGVVVAASPRAPAAGKAPRPARPRDLVDRPPADRPPAGLPPARRRTAVRGPAPGRRPSLIEATGEFVGEPRPDHTPYASSAWLRMVQAYRQLPAAATDEIGASIPGFAESAKPAGGSVTSWSSTVASAPPHPKSAPAAATPPRITGGAVLGPDATPAASDQRPRRASLAESRRLGIGRPLPREQRPPAEEQPSPPADRPAPDEPGQARPDGSDTGRSPGPSHVSGGTESPSITPPSPPSPPSAPAPSSAPHPPSAGAAQVRRRLPPHIGLGPPITLRGVSPEGGRPDRSPTETTSPDAGRLRPASLAVGQHAQPARPGQPPPASTPARYHPPGHSDAVDPASTAGQDEVPEAAHPVGAWPGHEPPPAEPASQAAGQQRRGRPSQDEERQVATAPSAIVAPVYRGAPPQARARAVRPPGHAGQAEPLVHRQAEQPVEPQLAAGEPSPAPQVTEPPADQVAPPPPVPPLPLPSAIETDFGAPGPPWLPPSQVSEAEPPAPPQDGEVPVSLVPYDLADTLRRMHGVDVSDVLVSRGPEAGQRARALGARAFTADGEIVLPPEAGPIERPRTQALLAHELTHAAQQRALGSTLPPEDSAAGAALESAAVAVERRVLGEEHHVRAGSAAHSGAFRAVAPADQQQPLFHAPPRPVPGWPAAESGGTAQRQTEEVSGGDVFDPFGLLPRQAIAPVPDLMLDGGPLTDQTAPPPAAPDVELALARTRLLELAEQRLLDLNDPIAVGELAEGVYKRIRARLQRELLIDRERSGLLSDFR